MSKKITLPIRFSLAISAALIAYFLILSLLGLHTNPIYSLFNGVITAFGIYEAIKYYKLEKGSEFDFSSGFTVGIVTGFIATLIFTLFFGIYAGNLNPDFLHTLISQWEDTYNTSLGSVIFVVALMGFATTVVITLSFMQLFKESWNPKKRKKE
ncbi:DUF4199 domain-containing protein [Croceiramulus getboli]|nr:DUF4199 domain-containing protein [Flavobacteriaceae bacterium YJPT1-3]